MRLQALLGVIPTSGRLESLGRGGRDKERICILPSQARLKFQGRLAKDLMALGV